PDDASTHRLVRKQRALLRNAFDRNSARPPEIGGALFRLPHLFPRRGRRAVGSKKRRRPQRPSTIREKSWSPRCPPGEWCCESIVCGALHVDQNGTSRTIAPAGLAAGAAFFAAGFGVGAGAGAAGFGVAAGAGAGALRAAAILGASGSSG